MPGSSNYGPVNETASDIFLEKTFLISGYLTALGYGVQLVLYIACMRILWMVRNRSGFTYFLLFYITLLCSMNTIWTATAAVGLQLTFIDNRNYPGGVSGFLNVEFSLPSNIASTTSYIIGNILADALLLWRCRVIWSASLGARGDYLMIFPTLTLLASIAMGVAWDLEAASLNSLHSLKNISFGIPYFAMTLFLNIILTTMIADRIWHYQRSVKSVIGGDFATHYTSITTMFVESAAIYSVTTVLLLITFTLGNPINQIWLAITPSVQLITTYLIIYRVAEGRAWGADTITNATGHTAPVFRRTAFTTTGALKTIQDTTPSNPEPDIIINYITTTPEHDEKDNAVHVVSSIQTLSIHEATRWNYQGEV